MSSVDVTVTNRNFLWVQFQTKYVTQNQDNRLAVCGSISELGNWNIQHAALADERPVSSGNWLATVQIPTATEMEWKWVEIKQSSMGISALRWEERSNRWYNTGYKCGTLHAPWNREYAFHPAPTENVHWDMEDTEHLDRLIEVLEKQVLEQGGSTHSLHSTTEGVFHNMITWFREHFNRWYQYLKNFLRSCFNSVCSRSYIERKHTD